MDFESCFVYCWGGNRPISTLVHDSTREIDRMIVPAPERFAAARLSPRGTLFVLRSPQRRYGLKSITSPGGSRKK
jgi:hypothetical protein